MTTPAVEVRAFTVTVPADTAKSAPYTEVISFPPRVVTGVQWRVPPGPAGLMGWQLTMSGGVPVIPYGGSWIVADDQSALWPLRDFPDNGVWEVTAYNTDIYDHAVYLEFLLDLVTTPAPAAVLPSNASLSSPPGTAAAGITAG